MVRKKSKMGGVFQGESIYESNLKHARPRADFKNGNSKEKELIRNVVIRLLVEFSQADLCRAKKVPS